jgi:hypothetical protein
MIFAETTTLGVRRREEQRQTLARRWETVDTAWGPVRIKIANMNGSVSNYAPEYEDCRALAEAQHVPLRTVMQEAIQQYLRGEQKHEQSQGVCPENKQILNPRRELICRPFGAASDSTFDPRLAPWAAILRRFAAIRSFCIPIQSGAPGAELYGRGKSKINSRRTDYENSNLIALCTLWSRSRRFSCSRGQLRRWAAQAPEFTLNSQEGTPVSLKDYRGKWVVLYFYPKDFTSGCTIEAHNFQRDLAQYQQKNA